MTATLPLLLMGLQEYYDKKLTDAQVRLYSELLSDLAPELLEVAVKKHISLSQWFPKVSELRALALEGEPKDPLIAWGEVREALKRIAKNEWIYCDTYKALRSEYNPNCSDEEFDKMRDTLKVHCLSCKDCHAAGLEDLVADEAAVRLAKGMGVKYLLFSDDEMADRAHFIKSYVPIAAAQEREKVYLPGVVDTAKKLTAGAQ